MKKNMNISKPILLCVLTALAIIWTGIGYIKWFYGLFDCYSAGFLDISASVVDYALQAVGVLIFILYIRRHTSGLRNAMYFVITGELVVMIAATVVSIVPLKLILGYVMVLFIGMLTGGYITLLAALLTDCGLVYGIAAALGGILSYLITLPFGGALYLGNASTAVYVVIAVALILLIGCLEPDYEADKIPDKGRIDDEGKKIILQGLLLLLFLCMTMNMSYMFPVSDLATGGGVSLEIVRAASAAGLLLAGIVVTKSRRSGLLLCICALVSPFLCMAVTQNLALKLPAWIISYILMGVYSVFCVVLFADISGKYGLYLAAAGMMIRRAGESLGNGAGLLLSNNMIILIILTVVLFVATVFISAAFARRMNNVSQDTVPAEPDNRESKSKEERFGEFVERYDISERERDVLRCVLDGRSNAEAAAELFISENTVKFHIKNILKKTGATNRKELQKMI